MSANATLNNAQATRQRNVIRGLNPDNSLGTSTDSVIDLFSPDAPKSSDMESIENIFNAPSIGRGENVDFEEIVSLEYKNPDELYTEVASQTDKPNTKGPQLKTIKIGSNGAPDIENSGLELDSANTAYIGRNRGFGVTEAPQDFPGRYNSSGRQGSSTLGDYITSSGE